MTHEVLSLLFFRYFFFFYKTYDSSRYVEKLISNSTLFFFFFDKATPVFVRDFDKDIFSENVDVLTSNIEQIVHQLRRLKVRTNGVMRRRNKFSPPRFRHFHSTNLNFHLIQLTNYLFNIRRRCAKILGKYSLPESETKSEGCFRKIKSQLIVSMEREK